MFEVLGMNIMSSFDGKNAKTVDKFDGVNIYSWKFKMKMVMTKDL